jgi:hypothetical protein
MVEAELRPWELRSSWLALQEPNFILSSCSVPPRSFTLPRIRYEQRVLTSPAGPKSGFPSARSGLDSPDPCKDARLVILARTSGRF